MIRQFTTSRLRRLSTIIASGITFTCSVHAQNAQPPAPTNTPAAPNVAANNDLAAAIAKIKGAGVIQAKGVVIGLSVKDCTGLTEADYKQIRQLEELKSLSFEHGPDDASLKILAGMPNIETFTTDSMKVTDAGLATLATFKKLHTLTFFHPGKPFTGTGLAALATLPNLTSFSVGGTTLFSDAGMAALAQLPHVQEIRVWHSGYTNVGVKSLAALKGLKSLSLGQQIAMKPPGTLNDETVAAVLDISSLESLSLSESRLSLAALSKLKQLPNLKRLTLKDIDISESDLAALKQQLPKVQIDWTAPADTGKKRIDGIFGALAAPAPAPNSAPSH